MVRTFRNLYAQVCSLENVMAAARTAMQGKYTYFDIHEPKLRRVAAAPFRDRVVHHALVRVLEPIFDHFVKQELGVKGYVRYVDDFLIFAESRERCGHTRIGRIGNVPEAAGSASAGRLRLHFQVF